MVRQTRMGLEQALPPSPYFHTIPAGFILDGFNLNQAVYLRFSPETHDPLVPKAKFGHEATVSSTCESDIQGQIRQFRLA
ncbi:hypothetical protein AVEN_151706-1 [Araneus ventricosus]|uniref:Uncharacterized protein n=1 Tax=Araneus ventricosus TaxID=182803 RepID=A0A4Y2DMY8_ARAVE|nr:hypothetical protein AVEN_151706-1 [Araneus ventricosus]